MLDALDVVRTIDMLVCKRRNQRYHSSHFYKSRKEPTTTLLASSRCSIASSLRGVLNQCHFSWPKAYAMGTIMEAFAKMTASARLDVRHRFWTQLV
jgi:hypothetical protein